MKSWNRTSISTSKVGAVNPYLPPVAEKRRFIQLNKAIAILLAAFIVLASANTALAWMIDEDLLVSEMGLGQLDKGAYAAVVRSPTTGAKSLVLGRGEIPTNRGEVIDAFYGFEGAEGMEYVPWCDHIGSIASVSFEDAVKPMSTQGWFAGARELEDISGLELLDMSDVKDASAMFEDCAALKELDMSDCNAHSLVDMSHMFEGCVSLVRLDLAGVSNEGADGAFGEDGTSTYRILAGCRSLEEIVLSPRFAFTGSDTDHALQVPSADHIPDADGYWYADQGSLPMTAEDASNFVNSRPGTAAGASTLRAYGSGYAALYGNSILVFGRGVADREHNGLGLTATYKGIESADQDFASSNVPWSNSRLVSVESAAQRKIPVAETTQWFYNQKALVDADTSSLDLSRVQIFQQMFYGCSNLKSIDVSDWDTSSAISMLYLFAECTSLVDVDVSNWDVSKCGNNYSGLENMFFNCSSIEHLDISNWDVTLTNEYFRYGNINYASVNIFSGCSSLKELDLTGIKLDESYPNPWNWNFTNCNALEKITVSSALAFRNAALPTPLSNRNGVVNSNFWYEDGAGEALTSAQACDIIREAFTVDPDACSTKTFYAYKDYTDDDAYAAYYVDTATQRNVMVFDRGAEVPEAFDDRSLSNVYREIETQCYGTSFAGPAWGSLYPYVKEVRINTALKPIHCGYWFSRFSGMDAIVGLERLDMSRCASLAGMFYNCTDLARLDGISDWDTSNCTSFHQMFQYCENVKELDTSQWASPNAKDMNAVSMLFSGCTALEEVDLSSMVLEEPPYNQVNLDSIFDKCSSLRKISFPHLAPGARPALGSTSSYYYPYGTFNGCNSLEELVVPHDFCFSTQIIPASRVEADRVVTGGMWYEDGQGAAHSPDQLHQEIVSRFAAGEGSSHWCASKRYAQDDAYAALFGDALVFGRGADAPRSHGGIGLDYTYREVEHPSFSPMWRSSNLGSMSIRTVEFLAEIHPASLKDWFSDLETLSDVDEMEMLKTENVSDFSSMFANCKAIASLDVSGFDTTMASSMRSMFFNMTSLKDLSLFALDASPDLDLYGVFSSCASLRRLDFSKWDMPRWSNNTRMNQILVGCSALEEILVSPTFNFSKVEASVYDYGNTLPRDYLFKDGFIAAAAWYESGSGRPYSYYDVSRKLADEYGTRTEAITFTRYPKEAAYAAVYEEPYNHHLHLEFDSGSIDEVANKHFEWDLKGIALGYDGYAWSALNINGASAPWGTSFNASQFVDVTVKSDVGAAGLDYWFSGFENCSSFDLAKLDVSSAQSMRSVFRNCHSVEELDLSAWDTSGVTNIGGGTGNTAVFNSCWSLKKLSIAGWDFGAAGTSAQYMITNCPALEEIDMSGCAYRNAPTFMSQCFNVKRVVIGSGVSFAGDFFQAIIDDEVGYDGNWYREDTHERFTINEARAYVNARFGSGADAVVFIAGFGDAAYAALYKDPMNLDRRLVFGRGFADIAIDGWDKEVEYRGIEGRAYNSLGGRPLESVVPWRSYRTNIVGIINNVPSDKPLQPVSINSWFYEMNNVSSIDMSMFDTTNTIDISCMLYGASGITNITGLQGWNTTQMVEMGNAFAGIKADFAEQIVNWNTVNVKSMAWMFWGCEGLSWLDLSHWDTRSLQSNYNMFYQCTSLETLRLPNDFVKASMTDVGWLFNECQRLTFIDAMDWDTSGLSNLNSLFHNCHALQSIEGIESWDTSNMVEMDETFRNCHALQVDCSSWDVSSVEHHDDFGFDAPGVVQPDWLDAVAVLDDEGSMVESDEEGVEGPEAANQEGTDPMILRAGENEMELDPDARPITDGVLSQVRLSHGVASQIRFTVNLFTGQRVTSGFYR